MVQLTGDQWGAVLTTMAAVALICALCEWMIRKKEARRHQNEVQTKRTALKIQARGHEQAPVDEEAYSDVRDISHNHSKSRTIPVHIQGAKILHGDKSSAKSSWWRRSKRKSSAELAKERLISLGLGQKHAHG